MTLHYLRTPNNGGCGKCACHCHSARIDIPPGHIPSCKFADPNYVSPEFEEVVRDFLAGRKRAGGKRA